MSKSLERILEKYPELDTPLYKEAYRKQEEGIPPREVSTLKKRLAKLFVLGGSGFAASFLAACQPAPAMVAEVSPTPKGIDLDLVFSSPEKATETPTQKPSPTIKPTAVPTEIPPTEIPPTPTEAPTSTPSLTPEPTKTFTPEPTPTFAPEVFGGRRMTKEELAYLSGLGGGEEMLALVDESLQEFPLLRPFLLMGAQAILSGQTGIVEVLPAAGEGESWFVFRGTIDKEIVTKVKPTVVDLATGESVSLRSGDNLTAIAEIPPEGNEIRAYLVMYEEWRERQVTYHLGKGFLSVESALFDFEEHDEREGTRPIRIWQPNSIDDEVWQAIQAELGREKEMNGQPQMTVRTDALNLRAGPGTQYEKIGLLIKGKTVNVIGRLPHYDIETWHLVSYWDEEGKEIKGWILALSDYVEANEAVKNVPSVPEEEIPPLPEPKDEPSKFVSHVLRVEIDAQDFSLSCESSAAAMVAAHFQPSPPEGHQSWEEYFIKVIPQNCNPHRGYRGKIDGLLSTSCDFGAGLGYGVYAEPVAEALQRAGIPAQVEYGVDYGAVEGAIKENKPVIVWVSGRKEPAQTEIDPETGQEYLLIYGEHAWTVIGVRGEGSQRQFLINDPWKNKQYWARGFPRWSDFNGMRVVVG